MTDENELILMPADKERNIKFPLTVFAKLKNETEIKQGSLYIKSEKYFTKERLQKKANNDLSPTKVFQFFLPDSIVNYADSVENLTTVIHEKEAHLYVKNILLAEAKMKFNNETFEGKLYAIPCSTNMTEAVYGKFLAGGAIESCETWAVKSLYYNEMEYKVKRF